MIIFIVGVSTAPTEGPRVSAGRRIEAPTAGVSLKRIRAGQHSAAHRLKPDALVFRVAELRVKLEQGVLKQLKLQNGRNERVPVFVGIGEVAILLPGSRQAKARLNG